MYLAVLPVWAAPGDILYQNPFSNNGNLNDWDKTSSNVTLVNSTFNSPSRSVRIPAGQTLTLKTSKAINAVVPAAQLSVWVQRGETGFVPGAGDDLQLQYLNILASWITLETFPGGGSAGETFNRTYNVPADGLYSQLRLRFINTSPSGANDDYWYVDDVIVTEVAPAATVDHYGISHSGAGLTCEAEPVTITAYDAGGTPVPPSSGTTITLSTTPGTGTWSGGNSYTFTGTETFAVKYLSHTTPATLNIDVSDGAASESLAADPDITFADVGIRFYGDTASSPLPHQVAGVTDSNLVLRVVETNTDTGACVPRLQNTSRDVALAYECNNPTTCSGGQTLSLNGAGVQANDNGAVIAYTTVNLSFDANGFAAIPFAFSDVGQIQLHAQLSLPAEGNDPAITVTAASSPFVVKPFSLVIIAVETAGGSANPGTQGAGSGFVPAGEAFVVRLEGRNGNGARTPAFGSETAPESVQVAVAALVFPAGGDPGVLGNAASFSPLAGTPGVYENTGLTWSEVGTMQLSPSLADGDYLGAGAVTGAGSGYIGRFYPAQFQLASSSVANSCVLGNFSTMSEPAVTVAFRVEAHNLAGAVVINYDSVDLNYPTGTLSLVAESDNDGTDLGARLAVATGGWDNGAFDVSDSTARFLRDATPDGPFPNLAVGVRITDLDGADFSSLDLKADASNDCVVDGNCDSKALSGTLEARFGRLYARDAHGPESAPIPMVWQTEYWNGSRFALNSDDHCSELPLAAVDFVGANAQVDAGGDTITVKIKGVDSVFDFSDPVGASDCLLATAIRFCDGRAGLAYGAPGSIVDYPVDMDLSALPWLQGDWNQDGSYTDSSFPRITIRFQHYRGHDRVIYWREVLQ